MVKLHLQVQKKCPRPSVSLYEVVTNTASLTYAAPFTQKYKNIQFRKILDVGAGTGRYSVTLAEEGLLNITRPTLQRLMRKIANSTTIPQVFASMAQL